MSSKSFQMAGIIIKNTKIVNENSVNSGNIRSKDNPDPSSMNDNNVIEKEQRLIGEESTNNPNTSAEHLAGLVEQMNSNNRISIKELKSLLNTLS